MSSHAQGVKERVARGIARRYRRERNFRLAGLGAVLVGMAFLAFFFYTLIGNGYTAFLQTHILLEVELSESSIDPDGERDPQTLGRADYQGVIRNALMARFPQVEGRNDLRELFALVSPGAGFELRSQVLANPELVGQTIRQWVVADDDVDMLVKGHMDRTAEESQRRINDSQLGWIEQLEADGSVARHFNHRFFTSGDSRDPEMSGIWSAVVGSFFMLLVTLALSFPLGVATAIYLEEFAPKNRWTDLIEVNINNLAAVPSIVFGLLGLALFINFFGLPRSAPVVGGVGIDPDDAPGGHHRGQGIADVCSTVHSGGGAGGGRIEDADDFPSRHAAGVAGHAHRNDHRHGESTGRVRAAAHDRDGCVYRRRAGEPAGSGNRSSGAGLPVGRQP